MIRPSVEFETLKADCFILPPTCIGDDPTKERFSCPQTRPKVFDFVFDTTAQVSNHIQSVTYHSHHKHRLRMILHIIQAHLQHEYEAASSI